ncbi:hypothetical protein SEA_SLEEPYHEAD_35 [Rhodococcus phage Sleepyhead]|uniref:Uncharacterized protein n=2 Tax=Caudoviricetes TaxID=2731619 RepID=A0A515MKA6_9CAUD|nr:hypothetical protein HWC38_gp35 [Rhodococcus phage Sleepyhead]YP_009848425.1 hypothetical protein HWC40_gp35 [Rhodococcus phage Whack]QDM56050.1 hypothetical protein SEA_SLEEPYHEAD_35 [Rhodococcus phage Sleepyhead]QDM57098.1 hypothetical protein SEA_WHACK_35 [Rhodococcus phage Whack]
MDWFDRSITIVALLVGLYSLYLQRQTPPGKHRRKGKDG